MSMNSILYDLRSDNEEFITTNTIKGYSNKLYYEVEKVIKYLTSQGYIIEILNDMFYIKDINEFNGKELKYSQYELLSKALAFKNVNSWYFGLHTALSPDIKEKNEISFDKNDSVTYVINDRLSIDKPFIINGEQFSFLVFKKELLSFGLKKIGKYQFSNLEKTILDFIYLYACNRVGDGKIFNIISKYKDAVSMERIVKYSKHYPATVSEILEKSNFFRN